MPPACRRVRVVTRHDAYFFRQATFAAAAFAMLTRIKQSYRLPDMRTYV